jgi:hypothetical protein
MPITIKSKWRKKMIFNRREMIRKINIGMVLVEVKVKRIRKVKINNQKIKLQGLLM